MHLRQTSTAIWMDVGLSDGRRMPMPARAPDPTPLLPLPPVVLHILLALAAEERHGYAIAQEVERVTGGAVRLGTGTLYGSLQRMLDAGLIREGKTPADEGGHSERRRYYEITPL